MYSLRVEKRVLKELRRYPPKIFKQIASRIFALQVNPRPHDCKRIGPGYRVDSGEYRIYYHIDDADNRRPKEKTVSVLVVGKRNDAEIYKTLQRMKLA